MTLFLALIAIVASIVVIVFGGRIFKARASRPSTVAELSQRDWSVLSNFERALLVGICLGLCAAFLLFVRSKSGADRSELLIYGVSILIGVACAAFRRARFNR